jgi:hypothetical protein
VPGGHRPRPGHGTTTCPPLSRPHVNTAGSTVSRAETCRARRGNRRAASRLPNARNPSEADSIPARGRHPLRHRRCSTRHCWASWSVRGRQPRRSSIRRWLRGACRRGTATEQLCGSRSKTC